MKLDPLQSNELDSLNNQITQLESQLREREAQFATMREALEKIRVRGEAANWNKCSDHDWTEYKVMNLITEALSTTAGRDLLERLQKAEGERDRYLEEWREANQRIEQLSNAAPKQGELERAVQGPHMKLAELDARYSERIRKIQDSEC
jgi:peptidoglycan hydrolase CwlO-like protein